MTCDLPARQCLAWHIKDHLAEVKLNGDGGLRARCPVCHRRDLTINPGDHARIVWRCFTCDDQDAVRRALLAAGISHGCLPPWRNTEAENNAAALEALRGSTGNTSRLRAYLILKGYRHWPRGAELERLAGELGISRAGAFAATKSGLLRGDAPRTPVPRRQFRVLSSGAGQTACHAGEKVQPTGQVRPTGQQKVQPTGRSQKVQPTGQVPAYRAERGPQ